jgi:PAS domain S-box-containing protein
MQGVITTFNRGAELMLGYGSEELIGKHTPAIFHLADEIETRGKILSKRFARLVEGFDVFVSSIGLEDCEETEWTYVRKDGEHRTVILSLSAIKEDDGNLVGYLGVAKDITERKDSERALSVANLRLNSVLECTSDCVMTIDRDWILVYGNRRATEGLPDFEIGKSYWQCFPEVASMPTAQYLRTVMTERKEMKFENYYSPYDRHYEVQAFPSGEGLTIFFSDITIEKKIQQQREREVLELAAAYGQVNSVMQCTSDGIIKIGHDWTIQYGNRRAVDSVPDFRIGENYWSCFPALLTTPTERNLRSAMEERVETKEVVYFAPYEKWYTLHAFPTDDGISLFFADITAERYLQDQLEREQLLREKRIEALSHMAGGLAHEISNPLAIIHARASDLNLIAERKEQISSEALLVASGDIVRTSDRALRILRGLRGFAHEGSKDPMQPAYVADIVDQCLELQQTRFETHEVEIRIEIPPDIPLIECREIQVGQIITNLLNNAYDAILQHAGDEDLLKSQEPPVSERWISLSAAAVGDQVVIDVTDSGPGIEEKFRPHLMEPFFTTKELGAGLGVGLSLSRAIAQEHGGTLTLCSDTEHTRFRLVLPVKQAMDEQGVQHQA